MKKFIEKIRSLTRRQRLSIFFGFLILVGFLLIGYAFVQYFETVEFVDFQDKGYGVRMKYPKTWKLVRRPQNVPGAVAAFVAPQQTAMDTFYENVNITSQGVGFRTMSLQQFSKVAMKQLTGTFEQSVRVLASRPYRLAGRPAHLFMYVGQGGGQNVSEGEYLQYLHVWGIRDNRGYIITFIAKRSEFKKYHRTVNHMIKSFGYLE